MRSLILVMLALGCDGDTKIGANMNSKHEQSFAILQDTTRGLLERVQAARFLGTTKDKGLIPELHRFLQRQHPPDEPYIEYDPRIPERIVDIAVIGALHELGDDSQWDLLIKAISEAAGGAGQQMTETEIAGETIGAIGSTRLVGQVVNLCGDKKIAVVANAVRTLVDTPLPEPATHQNVYAVAGLARPIEIPVNTISQYLNDIAKASDGMFKLSAGVRTQLGEHDYKVSDGQIEKTTVAAVLDRTVRLHNFAYYIEDDKATVCTFREAGQRWLDWWKTYGDKLTYLKDKGRFMIKG